LRSIPSSAEGADQADALETNCRAWRSMAARWLESQCGFGRKHLKVAGDAALVALVGEIE